MFASRAARTMAPLVRRSFTAKATRKAPWAGLLVALGVAATSTALINSKEKEKAISDGSASSSQLTVSGKASKSVLAQIAQVDNKHFRHIIVGAGVAGMAALEELVRKEPDADILMVNAENSMPYVRYPLSKELWLGSNEMVKNISRAVQMLSEDDFKAQYPNVVYLRGVLATSLDPEAQRLEFEGHGAKFSASYDQCLLATGARPRRPACVGQGETFGGRVIKFREVADYERLQEYASTGQDIVVVGGGFLGTELANAINLQSKQAGANIEPRAGKKQRQVTHVIPEPGVLYRYLPLYLADYTANRMSSHGVDMRTNSIITGIQWVPPAESSKEDVGHMVSEVGPHGSQSQNSDKGHMLVEMTIRTLGNMRRGPGSAIHNKFLDVRKYTIKADCVVYCVGVDPNSEISKLAGLEVDKDKAIIADSTLRVVNNVYAAGDVVSYHDKILGRRRMEHHDHAEATGKHAARNMCAAPGAQTDFSHLSEFWSDLMDLGVHFEGVGNIQNHFRTVGYWNLNRTQFVSPVQDVPDYEACEYKKGLVYYLDEDNRVVGVLTWNIKGQLHHARELIKKKLKYEDPVFDLRDALDIRDQHGLKATMCT